MSVKLKAGSMDLETAFIEWLRAQGYNPADGIDPFFSESDFVRSQMPMIHESEKEQLAEEARLHLKRRCADPTFSGQFPVVYHCLDKHNQDVRYTVALTLSDEGAEWAARLWSGTAYLGEFHGSDNGSHAHYLDLARANIESHIKRTSAVKQQVR
jgi:hypothetical protein